MKLKNADTLFTRVFLLLVVTFSISSFLAFEAFRATAPEPPGWHDGHPVSAHGPPPFPGGPAGTGPDEPAHAFVHGPQGPHDPHGPPGPPWIPIALDVAIKLVAGALAAWFAARALSLPMRRLSDAARRLGQSLSPAAGVGIAVAPPQLDEVGGTREVRETARAFNELARQLKTDFDTQRLLLATVSHDLRTPLTRLRMRLFQLEAHPEARRAIDDVREMDELIESLLALFRPPSTAPHGDRRVDAFALVQAIVDDLPSDGPEIVLEGTSVSSPCAPAALRRMFGNLLENAVRHGGGAGAIEIRVGVDAGMLAIHVADRGPGLSEEQLAHAGTPFLRWAGETGETDEAASQRRAGLGLGLYITRALAEREGGRLTLAARAGGGLSATLHLPR